MQKLSDQRLISILQTMKPVGKIRKKQYSRALAKTFSQNLEGGGGVEFGKDILANLNYADSLRTSRGTDN